MIALTLASYPGEHLSQVRDISRQQAVGIAEIAKQTGLTRQSLCRVTRGR